MSPCSRNTDSGARIIAAAFQCIGTPDCGWQTFSKSSKSPSKASRACSSNSSATIHHATRRCRRPARATAVRDVGEARADGKADDAASPARRTALAKAGIGARGHDPAISPRHDLQFRQAAGRSARTHRRGCLVHPGRRTANDGDALQSRTDPLPDDAPHILVVDDDHKIPRPARALPLRARFPRTTAPTPRARGPRCAGSRSTSCCST